MPRLYDLVGHSPTASTGQREIVPEAVSAETSILDLVLQELGE